MDMDTYRSILLADVIGKVSARAHRLAILGALASDLSGEHSWQCGGVPGLGTAFPVLAIRLPEEKAQAEGTSIANIFVGARQAFYAIIRNLLLSVIETDQAVVSLFKQLKIPPATMEELKAILRKGPAMEDSTLSALTVRDIASNLIASHFEVRGFSKLGSVHKDARPGRLYADVLFSLAFH